MVEVGQAFYEAISGDDNGAILVRAEANLQHLNIPQTVSIGGRQLTVKRVRRLAVANHENLEDIVFPPTLEVIENGAFLKGTKLSKITLPQDGSLQIIGDGAFYECKELLGVAIPLTVRELRPWCFKDCTKLRRATVSVDSALELIDDSAFESTSLEGTFVVPVKVTRIMDRAFRQTQLTKVEFGHPEQDDSLLEWLAPGSLSETKIAEILIPSRCRNIGEWTFMNTPTLRKVEFAGGTDHQILNIGCYWLKGTNVRAITIPKSATAIKDFAFQDLKDLSRIEIPPDVQIDIIGPKAIANTKVPELKFGNALRDIEPQAFEQCEELVTFEVPTESKLRRCKTQIFHNCFKLKRLVLPGVDGFDSQPFDGCTGLRVVKFTLPGQSKELRNRVMVMPDSLFPEGARIFITYPEGTLKSQRDALRKSPGEFE
jgi:hypothetical protein